ncbi:hypothetical protein GCM10009872_46990 [Actinopolymorpha rutila]
MGGWVSRQLVDADWILRVADDTVQLSYQGVVAHVRSTPKAAGDNFGDKSPDIEHQHAVASADEAASRLDDAFQNRIECRHRTP